MLLLLPPLAKLSSLVGENIQFARMFGGSLDPLLVELFADNTSEVIPSPSTKERLDVSTQTYSSTSPSLPSDLGEIHDEMPACTEPSRPAPTLLNGDGGTWFLKSRAGVLHTYAGSKQQADSASRADLSTS
ncbi:hypothetical protein DICVIV_11829 [Dictyocaulus viviparus]|uniref:Uncharacterized protein n=1 Tax=Dictyocaulus viviparus TaxID=29172 RepID=A0A0D8XEU8_DICVI|nr:hypothetical protein DICVIV_11829 [Dictyocaulus viviparus]